jgi:activator of 2-hydroxyglutaryl-CoA dehydratase
MRTSCVLGIDVGGTTTKLALVRAGDEPTLVGKATVDTRPAEPAADLVKRIADAAEPLLATTPSPLTALLEHPAAKRVSIAR